MSKPTIAERRKQVAEEYVSRLQDFNSISEASRDAAEKHPDLFSHGEVARNCLRAAKGRKIKRAKVGAATEADTDLHGFDKRLPEGFAIKGVSAYFDKEGNTGGVWIKTNEDRVKQMRVLRESYEALIEDIPKVSATPAPVVETPAKALCNLYIVTDAHLGMMASEGEAGESWGLKRGEDVYGRAFDGLIHGAPKATKGVIAQLGDFLHFDGLDAVTTRSGHPLDADARFSDIVRAATRLLRRMISTALTVHETVEVIIAEGNHDPASAVWLRVAFEALFENEPRVSIVDSDLPFYSTTHGETMLGFHHGHIKNIKTKASASELALLFADGEDWRNTRKRYIHTGHHHDEATIEVRGAKLYAHPTLAAPDAYASRNFGGSMREMSAHSYHEKHGKVGILTISPEMLK